MKKTLSYAALALFALLWAAPFAFGQSAPPTGGAAATVTAVDTTNGLSLSNGTVSLAAAGAAANGAVTTGTQTFAGAKTFSGGITTSGFTSGNSSSLTAGANFTMIGGGTLGLGNATGDRGLVNNNIGAAVATSTIAAVQIKHSNGALDATDLVLSVLNSADHILLGVAQSGNVVSYGGHQINTAGASEPTCNAAARGTVWYTASAGGVADKIQVCAKSAADAYAWRSMATIP